MLIHRLLLPVWLIAFHATASPPAADDASRSMDLFAGRAGLFVGVARVGPRETANVPVDDAVALAYLYVVEHRMLPPKRTTIALSGAPTPERAAQLRALEEAGVERIPATREAVRDAVRRVAMLPRNSDDFLIVSLSSVGFEVDGAPYVATDDTDRAAPANTALDLVEMANLLGASKATEPLMFVDAVRDQLPSGSREAAERREARFVAALGKTSGVDIIGAVTSEHSPAPSSHPGLSRFAALLIDGLRGAAASRPEIGLISLYDLICYVEPRLRGEVTIGGAGSAAPHYVRASEHARTLVAVTTKEAEGALLGLRTATICHNATLLLEVSDDADPAPLGSVVTYTIRVTSQFPRRIYHDIEISGELPTGLSFQSSDGPTGAAKIDGRRFNFASAADIAPGGKLEFRVVAKCETVGDSRLRVEMLFRENDRGPIEETESTRVW